MNNKGRFEKLSVERLQDHVSYVSCILLLERSKNRPNVNFTIWEHRAERRTTLVPTTESCEKCVHVTSGEDLIHSHHQQSNCWGCDAKSLGPEEQLNSGHLENSWVLRSNCLVRVISLFPNAIIPLLPLFMRSSYRLRIRDAVSRNRLQRINTLACCYRAISPSVTVVSLLASRSRLRTRSHVAQQSCGRGTRKR